MNTGRIKLVLAAIVVVAANAVAGWLAPMPPQRELTRVDGSEYSFVWEGQLHVHDSERMRRLGAPFPKKRGLRILAVGDSFTYGYGVAESDAWPAQLAKITDAEVLNMGVSGNQSDETAKLVRNVFVRERYRLWRFGGPLTPDAIVYAVCLNDLESNARRWMPWWSLVDSRIALLRLPTQRMPSLRTSLALYADPTRFRLDVAEMSAIAALHDAPLYVAVFDNQRLDDWRKRAEREIDAATPRRIPFVLPAGDWRVSRWEGHPNAAAHRLFAEAVAGWNVVGG